jgi:predicted DNA-binding transcriptional regulator YafY
VRLLAAWCELRQDFRHFRTDRIVAADFLDARHGARPGELRKRWKRSMEKERGVRLP